MEQNKEIAVIGTHKRIFDIWVKENGKSDENYRFVNRIDLAYGVRYDDFKLSYDVDRLFDFEKIKEVVKLRLK